MLERFVINIHFNGYSCFFNPVSLYLEAIPCSVIVNCCIMDLQLESIILLSATTNK